MEYSSNLSVSDTDEANVICKVKARRKKNETYSCDLNSKKIRTSIRVIWAHNIIIYIWSPFYKKINVKSMDEQRTLSTFENQKDAYKRRPLELQEFHFTGSCWAFSAVGAVEGILYIRTKKLISLSTQQVVDYDHRSLGCKGGWIENAFLYIRDHGITTEECYPYRGNMGKSMRSRIIRDLE